jgi:hypothetical protein
MDMVETPLPEKSSTMLEISEEIETILKVKQFSSYGKVIKIKKAPQKIAKMPQDFNQTVEGAERQQSRTMRGGSTIKNWSFIKQKKRTAGPSTQRTEMCNSPIILDEPVSPLEISSKPRIENPADIISKVNSFESMKSSLRESMKVMVGMKSQQIDIPI